MFTLPQPLLSPAPVLRIILANLSSIITSTPPNHFEPLCLKCSWQFHIILFHSASEPYYICFKTTSGPFFFSTFNPSICYLYTIAFISTIISLYSASKTTPAFPLVPYGSPLSVSTSDLSASSKYVYFFIFYASFSFIITFTIPNLSGLPKAHLLSLFTFETQPQPLSVFLFFILYH